MEKNKLRRKIELTTNNFGQMANRLERRNFMFQFLLMYYSVIGIVNELFPLYFNLEKTFNATYLSFFNFWNICTAIIFLIFSSQIALFKYPERTKSCMKSLNNLKELQNDLETEDENKIKDKYYKIISEIDFLFSRTDFYLSCVTIDKGKEEKDKHEVKNHFGFFEKFFINIKLGLEYLAYILLVTTPIIMYIYIFIKLFQK